MNQQPPLPLVYACSGASSAAQMANYIAVRLDRMRAADMSCIAGVGGDVKPLLRVAHSGRPIIALDGCPLRCAAQILKRHGLEADQHYDLGEMGVKKRSHQDFDVEEANRLLARIAGNARTLSVRQLPPAAVDADFPESSSPVCYLRDVPEE